MKDSQKRSNKRPKLVESFNNVPNLLEKARQAVDEVTEQAPKPKGAAKSAKRQPKAAAPKKPAKESSKPQKPARKAPAASSRKKTTPAAKPPKKAAPAATSPPPAPREEPLWDLAECGISVKHALPGRIRLRLRKLLYNEAMAAKLPPLLAAVPGVTAAEASTATGSLLITFSSRDLAGAQSRRELAGVMHQFFPRLDTERLLARMLGS